LLASESVQGASKVLGVSRAALSKWAMLSGMERVAGPVGGIVVASAMPQAHRGEEWRAAELARLAFPTAPATKEAGYQAPEARPNSRGLGGPGQEKTR